MTGLPTLSLHQPWASLCLPLAPGEKPVKEIETRGWSTKFRGRLLIHAAATTTQFDGAQEAGWHYLNVGDYEAGWCAKTSNEGTRGRTSLTGPGIEIEDQYRVMPLGVIVGSVELVDVVSIESVAAIVAAIIEGQDTGRVLSRCGDSLAVYQPGEKPVLVSDQLPYGDFTAGRYAWLFESAKLTTERCPACWGRGRVERPDEPENALAWLGAYDRCSTCEGKGTCEPIPAKGRQGLWRWTP